MSGAAFGHDRQCGARSHNTGSRCGRWALIGSKYCQFHGGRRSAHRTTGKHRLGPVYEKLLGPNLRDRVAALLAAPRCEQTSLYEEIALARVQLDQALKLAVPVLEGTVVVPDEVKHLALATLRASLEHVAGLVTSMSKIEQGAADKISVHAVNLFVVQICKAIKEELGDNPALAERIGRAIDEKVRLPLDDRRALDAHIRDFAAHGDLVATMDALTCPPSAGTTVAISGKV